MLELRNSLFSVYQLKGDLEHFEIENKFMKECKQSDKFEQIRTRCESLYN